MAALEAGCFHEGTELRITELSNESERCEGFDLHTWRLEIPALPEQVFDPLCRMCEATVRHGGNISSVGLDEVTRTDGPRVDRDALSRCPRLNVPFAVENHILDEERKGSIPILVTFDRDVDDRLLAASKAMFEAWGKVVFWGGFPPMRGSEGDPCGGVLEDVCIYLSNQVIANVEYFGISRPGWAALLRGLLPLRALAGVVGVEIG